jgi:short-subunit dehydrogenase
MNAGHLVPAVVVTGASSGVGREFARLAIEDGVALVLVGRSEPALAELVQELSARRAANRILKLSIDLQRADAVAQIDALLSENGLYCDVLINSAGFGVFGPAADCDSSLQVQIVDVNVKAIVALSLRFLPGMLSRGRGGIINIGSITGYSPGPYMAGYCASKAFVRSFSAALSAEVAGSGVTVTCLTPGILRTAFFDRAPMGHSRLMKILPRGNAEKAARIAWTAFKQGRSLVVPRLIDRFVLSICWLTPDWLLARLVLALQRAS